MKAKNLLFSLALIGLLQSCSLFSSKSEEGEAHNIAGADAQELESGEKKIDDRKPASFPVPAPAALEKDDKKLLKRAPSSFIPERPQHYSHKGFQKIAEQFMKKCEGKRGLFHKQACMCESSGEFFNPHIDSCK